MGRFSTTLNIKNTDLAKEFTELMKKRGYETCKADEATLSYLIAQGGEWATCACKDYNGNPKHASEDAELFANELKIPVIFVEVVDSDFAILRMNGDEVIAGDGSGYGIEDAPKGSKAVWEPLLVSGTFEELAEIWGANEVFVEDALCKSAPLLGIDPNYICADHRDLSELTDDVNITVLCFKKIGAGKPMTLNAGFIKVFGEALEPLGFSKIKGRYPYFVRVVPGGEIIHIITLTNERSYEAGRKFFKIFGGIATVYRDQIDLSKNPNAENINWMRSNSRISLAANIKYDFAYEGGFAEFSFGSNDESEMLYELEHSLDVTRKVMLPVISKAVDIDSSIECFFRMGMPLRFDESFECLLFLKTPRYADIFTNRLRKRADEYKEKMEQGVNGYTSKECEKKLQRANEVFQREISLIENVLNDPELLAKYTAELERRKAANTELLRSYGLDI